MWEYTVLGVDLYSIIAWLYLYSFFGWVWESCYVSIKERRIVNRGFIVGPLCTIYGVGAVSVYLILQPLSENLILLYIGGVVVATLLEYVTAVLMELLFHTSWWDYSDKKFNLKGRICLSSSLAWGVFAIVMFRVLHPFVENIVGLVPASAGEVALIVITILYAGDFIHAVSVAVDLGEKLKGLENSVGDLAEFVQRSRIYNSAEDLVEYLEPYRKSFNRANIKEKLEQFQGHLMKEFGENSGNGQMVELKAKIDVLKEQYVKAVSKTGWHARRLMKAYPNLSKASKTGRHKRKEKK